MKSADRPAILGGRPIFTKKMPLTRPSLVDWSKISKKIKKIIDTGQLTKGRHLDEFEKKSAAFLKVGQTVAVSSCTIGLVLTLRALELSGEVILPSFTFMATGGGVWWNNLKPVFVDVAPDTFNINPEEVEKQITSKTSAILAVHLFGNPAAVERLEAIARKYHLKLIFDAAHGFGALYQGQPLGRYGTAEVFSLSPTKLLVTGEGGLIATNQPELARKLKIFREYGNPGNYDCLYPGLNARMQEFSATLGTAGLAILEKTARKRNLLARVFMEELSALPGISFQKINRGNRCSYKDFVIIIDEKKAPVNRDLLATALVHENIDTRNYYDPPLHRQTVFKKWAPSWSLPVTDFLAQRALSLPISSKMTAAQVRTICRAIRRIFSWGVR
jgi:dTDP-4-amino-4,6-dideoxygalactose transaminase